MTSNIMLKKPEQPEWRKARYNGICLKCATQIQKGDTFYWYAESHRAYCQKCAPKPEGKTVAA